MNYQYSVSDAAQSFGVHIAISLAVGAGTPTVTIDVNSHGTSSPPYLFRNPVSAQRMRETRETKEHFIRSVRGKYAGILAKSSEEYLKEKHEDAELGH